MKKQNPIITRVGARDYLLSEPFPDRVFEHTELTDSWHVLQGADRFILYRDIGRHVIFLEFYPHSTDNFVYYKGREWERRPRNDNSYTLMRPKKFHGIRMPLQFGQALRYAVSKEQI